MYIRRWGGDPKEAFAIEMLKYKTYDSLNPTDRKILNATVDHSEDLDKMGITETWIQEETMQGPCWRI